MSPPPRFGVLPRFPGGRSSATDRQIVPPPHSGGGGPRRGGGGSPGEAFADSVARPRLIITADDFGAAPEVNEAVALAHTQGVLTAASLMVGAPAAEEAVAIARALPTLRVGLHLVLVEGRPVLAPSKVSALVGPDGRFLTDMARLGAAIFFRADARRQIAAEIEAQFAAFAATGLALDHANAHKHFHLHPTICGLMIRVGRRHGLTAVRAPVEPRAILRAIEPDTPGTLADVFVDGWARLARARLRGAGLAVPDQVFGLAWSGAMTERRLAGLIEHLPPGLTEIYTHPAIREGYRDSAPGYHYRDELAALLSTEARARLAAGGARPGGFADLA